MYEGYAIGAAISKKNGIRLEREISLRKFERKSANRALIVV
jgi:hypothetical protein